MVGRIFLSLRFLGFFFLGKGDAWEFFLGFFSAVVLGERVFHLAKSKNYPEGTS